MDDEYECIGVCEPDPETGRCLACARPLSAPALAGMEAFAETAGETPETCNSF